jgi:hypothetical protein
MNRIKKNDRALIELILFALLTFTVILILRSSFSKGADNPQIRNSEPAAATDHIKTIEKSTLVSETASPNIQCQL